MAYNVYRVENKLCMQDPLMRPGQRTHNSIFVETNHDGGGLVLHVIGAITDPDGMRFEDREGGKPDEDEAHLRKHYLGQIQAAKLPDVIRLMRSVPTPPLQRDFDYKTMSWVPCKRDRSRYGPGETVPPYVKCTEWTLQRAIPALEQSGLLYPDGVPQNHPVI